MLSLSLFGRSLAIGEFPRRKDIRGIGLSCAGPYARRLRRKLAYTNTFYHKRPRLDICRPDPAMSGTLDFIIASDVFEHIVPPVSRAFENCRRLLKAGGVMVFSVPYAYEGSTVEHFPELHDYRIEKLDGRQVLLNRTTDGREQRFENLSFHGGAGGTLEMRAFSRPDLIREFEQAGFEQPQFCDENDPGCGVMLDEEGALAMRVGTCSPINTAG